MKTVGLIMEGKTDWAFFEPFIEAIFGAKVVFKELVPPFDNTGRHPKDECGWEGVEKNCKLYSNILATLMNELNINALIIQLDADVVDLNNFKKRHGKLGKPCPPAINTCNNVRNKIKEWLKFDPNHNVCHRIIIVVPPQATEAWIGILEFDDGTIDECTNKPDKVLSDRGIISWNYRNPNDEKYSKEYSEISKRHFETTSINSSQPTLFPSAIEKLDSQSEEAKNFITAIRNVLS